MAGSVSERLVALHAAVDAGQWDRFADQISAWADEEPNDAWLQAGRAVAAAARGEDPGRARPELGKLDARLADQVALLVDLLTGNLAEARTKIAREIAYGNRDSVLVDAFRSIDPGLAEPIKHLFAAPHLIAGCVLDNGQITAMAAKGSRMSADTLGHRTDSMWADLRRLNQRVNIGPVQSILVLAEDGGWAVASTGVDAPRIASVLVAAPAAAGEVAARAHVVIASLEAEHD